MSVREEPSFLSSVVSGRPPRLATILIVATIIVFYLGWKIGSFSRKESSENPAQTASVSPSLDHNALIQDQNFHINQGMAYGNAGLIDQAIFEQSEALRINPHSVLALNNLGFYYFQKGRYRESARSLEQALMLDPSSELIRNNLRNTYQKVFETSSNPVEKDDFRRRLERLETGTLLPLIQNRK